MTEFMFKVVELKLHQDRDAMYNLCGEEKLSELFNFKLTLQQRQLDPEKQDENKEPQNRIFISQNTKLIMVVQQGTQAEIYLRSEANPVTKTVNLRLM